MSTVSRKTSPKQEFMRDGKIRVSNTEVVSTVAVQDSSFSLALDLKINPVNGVMFPWLSAIANSYETYKFKKLEFRWVASTGTNTNGNILLAVDFDSTDASPNDIRDMMSYRNAVITNIWKNCTAICDPRDLDKRKTYFTGLTANDPNLRDTGRLYVAYSAPAAVSVAGYIEVDYVIELETPQKYVPPSFRLTGIGDGAFGSSSVTTTSTGSLYNLVNRISKSNITFNQAGKYLMSLGLTSSGNGSLSVSSPSGNVTATLIDEVWNGSKALYQYYLDVKRPSEPGYSTLSDLNVGTPTTDTATNVMFAPFYYS